eukprot:390028_1
MLHSLTISKMQWFLPLAYVGTVLGRRVIQQRSLADIGSMEAEVTKMASARITPTVINAAATIAELLNNTMIPGLVQTHNDTQRELDTITAPVFACDKYNILDSFKDTVADEGDEHVSCRSAEAVLYDDHAACTVVEDQLKGVKDRDCAVMQAVVDSTSNPWQDTCVRQGSEDYGAWVHRLEQHYIEAVDIYDPLKQACDVASAAHADKTAECAILKGQLDTKQALCNGAQKDLELASCKLHDQAAKLVTNYTICY